MFRMLARVSGLSGTRLAYELSAPVRLYNKPRCIVRNNRAKFTNRAIVKGDHRPGR